MKLLEELTWRGFVNQTTFDSPEIINKQKLTFYWGVDPSADSMTIGNLAAAMMAKHFISAGHKAYLLIGGATGLIGDPDGKSTERALITPEEVKKNKEAIISQYKQIFSGQEFEIIDNLKWFDSIKYIDFLREVGKHVPMRQMLGREFIQTRLGEAGSGISYAEFSYVLIQAYDFLYLNKQKGVDLQLCGSDQWGNSIAGVDLIRRVTGRQAHVWSSPLVVNKTTGAKFGKSEEGAVWLDPNKTSPYSFYQYWLNVDDESVEDYLKIFTLINKDEHTDLMREFNGNKASRKAQKELAYQVTKLVHGEKTADSIRNISEILFGGGDYSKLSSDDFSALKSELPTAQASIGDSPLESIVSSGLANSKSDARRFLQQGAIYLNGLQVDENKTIESSDRLDSTHAILRRGKNNNCILQINE